MPPPTDEQLQLIKDFEPVLFFHGGDATVQEERFFPSDAKRYLERCALWKASDPFLTLSDWGNTPVVEAAKLGALPNEGDVFLGKGLPSGPFEFLETPADKECFLDVAGWEAAGSPFPSANRYANLDAIANLYRTDPKLKESEFWYHAEFFDADRLRRLFNSVLETGDTIIHFIDLFSGAPPFLINPALICYYLFYPGHDEGLSDCPYTDQAKEFGSFAGEWTCVAILLDSPSPGEGRAPKWIGLSNRNIGVIKFGGKEVRTGLRILPWSAVELFQTTHRERKPRALPQHGAAFDPGAAHLAGPLLRFLRIGGRAGRRNSSVSGRRLDARRHLWRRQRHFHRSGQDRGGRRHWKCAWSRWYGSRRTRRSCRRSARECERSRCCRSCPGGTCEANGRYRHHDERQGRTPERHAATRRRCESRDGMAERR